MRWRFTGASSQDSLGWTMRPRITKPPMGGDPLRRGPPRGSRRTYFERLGAAMSFSAGAYGPPIHRQSPIKTLEARGVFRSGTAEIRRPALRRMTGASLHLRVASEFVMSGTVRSRPSPLPGSGGWPGITMLLLLGLALAP